MTPLDLARAAIAKSNQRRDEIRELRRIEAQNTLANAALEYEGLARQLAEALVAMEEERQRIIAVVDRFAADCEGSNAARLLALELTNRINAALANGAQP